MIRDVEDLDAILNQTDAHFVFGLSSGAVITLQAACILSSITKIVVYEPPLYTTGAPTALMDKVIEQIDQDDLPGGMISALRASKLEPCMW